MATTCARCNAPLAPDRNSPLCPTCESETSPPPPADETTLPSTTTVREEGGRLILVHRWRSRQRVRLAVTAVVVPLGFSLVVTLTLMALGHIGLGLYCLVNISLLVLLALLVSALLTSTTVVEANEEKIRVRHRRYLVPATKEIPSDDLDQLYCIKQRRTGNTPFGHYTHNRFHVVALTLSGRKILLVPDLERRSHARFFEQILEKKLGIADRPVRGELSKKALKLEKNPKYWPSWRWGMLMKTFMSKSAIYRVKMFRDDEI